MNYYYYCYSNMLLCYSVCVSVCVRVCRRMSVCAYVCTQVLACACKCVCVCMFLWVWAHVRCVHVLVHAWKCACVSMCVRLCVCESMHMVRSDVSVGICVLFNVVGTNEFLALVLLCTGDLNRYPGGNSWYPLLSGCVRLFREAVLCSVVCHHWYRLPNVLYCVLSCWD